MIDEKMIKLAAKMYEARDAAKALFGSDYEAKISVPMLVLKQAAKDHDIGYLEAAKKIAQSYVKEHQGMGAMVIIAAAVELCERDA